jgi:alpha-D-xyloside xylohydrolase
MSTEGIGVLRMHPASPDGNNTAYERGRFSVIPFFWNDRTRTLNVSERHGNYAGMPKLRRFSATVIDGAEIKKTESAISCDGTAMSLSL